VSNNSSTGDEQDNSKSTGENNANITQVEDIHMDKEQDREEELHINESRRPFQRQELIFGNM